MDPKIVEAIEEAVEENGQTKVLARRLVAWFDAIASGNQDINAKQSADRHLELLYEATELKSIKIDYKMVSEYPNKLLGEATRGGKGVSTGTEVDRAVSKLNDPEDLY